LELTKISTIELLNALNYQYPSGVTTWGKCSGCDGSARGSAYCADCICRELSRRGYAGALLVDMCSLLMQRVQATEAVNACFRRFHDEMKKETAS
jgi:hypothetical protein